MKINDIQIKKAVRAGNSSAVILPRAWLNMDIRVELLKKTPAVILSDVLFIMDEKLNLSDIVGVYLVGSYARGEENEKSDIDILVITNGVDNEIIVSRQYNIIVISTELLNQKLKQDLFPIGQMIREAKPLLNSEYLKSFKIDVTKDNIKWYLETTKDKIDLIDNVLKISKNRNISYIDDKVIYTIILRIRTMYIIKCILNKEDYSKNDFIKMLDKVTKSNNAYESYLRVKNNLPDKGEISVKESEILNNYLKKLFEEIKKEF